MEHSSLPCSQEPATCPYLEPHEYIPAPHNVFLMTYSKRTYMTTFEAVLSSC